MNSEDVGVIQSMKESVYGLRHKIPNDSSSIVSILTSKKLTDKNIRKFYRNLP